MVPESLAVPAWVPWAILFWGAVTIAYQAWALERQKRARRALESELRNSEKRLVCLAAWRHSEPLPPSVANELDALEIKVAGRD